MKYSSIFSNITYWLAIVSLVIASLVLSYTIYQGMTVRKRCLSNSIVYNKFIYNNAERVRKYDVVKQKSPCIELAREVVDAMEFGAIQGLRADDRFIRNKMLNEKFFYTEKEYEHFQYMLKRAR